jgi:carbamoyltransferase
MRRYFRYHARYGYQYIPGIQARVPHENGAYLIRANQAGFRSNHEYATGRNDGVFRVALFGDSFTAADGVRNDDRYSDVAERLLDSVQIDNFGLPGSGTDQHLLIFEGEVLERGLEYDLIVIAVAVENVRRVVARLRPYYDEQGELLYYEKPYFTLGADGALTLQNVPVPRDPVPPDAAAKDDELVDHGGRFPLLRRISRELDLHDVLQRVTRYQPLPEYDDPHNAGWLVMRAILERWIAEAAAPVVLFPLPLYQYVEETASADSYRARFSELARAPAVVVHDPLPYFWRHDKATRRGFRFAKDIHPTPAAHAVLGEALADAIRPRLPAKGV